MINIKIFNEREKKDVEKILFQQFGIDSVPGKIIMRGQERLFLFSGDFTEKEIEELEKIAFIERMGIYFAKISEKEGIRLSIEGSQILKDQIKKNIFELDDSDAEQWMMGRELAIKTGIRGFLIIKNKNDFLGTGKASEEKIGNFIPKNRRLRERQQ